MPTFTTRAEFSNTNRGNGWHRVGGLIGDATGELVGATAPGGASGTPLDLGTGPSWTVSSTATAGAPSSNTITGTIVTRAPTVTGTVAGQTTTFEATIKPFFGVTVADANSGATDTLTITVGGTGGTLTGTGLSGGAGGFYTLSGTAASVTSDLDALSFKATAGTPNTSSTSTFTLSDKSSVYATATVNSATTVIDSDFAVAPTIAGTHTTDTTSQALVNPFSGVTQGNEFRLTPGYATVCSYLFTVTSLSRGGN